MRLYRKVEIDPSADEDIDELYDFVFALAFILMSITATSQVVYPFNAEGQAEFSEVVDCSLPKETVYKNALELAAGKSGNGQRFTDQRWKRLHEP